MSFVGEHEQRLILNFLVGTIRERDFWSQFSLTTERGARAGLALLKRALAERDPVGVEYGLYLGFRFRITSDYLQVLLALAEATWHRREEDVVDALADLGAPASVEVLYRLAVRTCPDRDYEEAHALAVKCIWALGGVQNRDALRRLADILYCGNRMLAVEAEAQWVHLRGNGRSQAVREVARVILAAAEATRTER